MMGHGSQSYGGKGQAKKPQTLEKQGPLTERSVTINRDAMKDKWEQSNQSQFLLASQFLVM